MPGSAFPPPVIFDTLISVCLVIALGWFIRQRIVPDPAAWRALESVSYYFLTPALIGKSLAFAKLGTLPFARLGGTLVGTVLILATLLVLARPLIQRALRIDAPAFTSVFQGSLRWNSFIALGFAANLFGNEGIAIASVAVASLIPLLNVLCIAVLRKYGTGGGSLLRGLVTNPFIIGTLGGLAINLVGLPIPRSVVLGVDILGQCALGTGLLLVGVGLRLQDLQRPNRALMAGIFIRLLITPLVGYSLAMLIGLSGPVLTIAIICLGVPTAGACYVLARQMGGDATLMAAIITGQTIASIATLPLLLTVLTG